MNFLKFLRKGTARLIIFSAIIYIFFTVGRSIWKNYQTNNEIKSINTELSEMRLYNDALNYKIAYYKTGTYKELALRSRLNLQKSGEKMVVLPKREENSLAGDTNSLPKPTEEKKANYELWIEYFK